MSARCLVQGARFSPATAERISGVGLSDKNEPGAIGNVGRYKDKPIPYGSATLESHPPVDLDTLLDTLSRCIQAFRDAGAEDITLHCDFFYRGQCNLELSLAQITCLSKLQIPITISCYVEAGKAAKP
jgi:hypothetical protein